MEQADAIRKYETIRTSFSKYLKTVKPASGSGRDTIVLKPEFEHLRWMTPYIRSRTTKSNLSASETNEDEVEELSSQPTDTQEAEGDATAVPSRPDSALSVASASTSFSSVSSTKKRKSQQVGLIDSEFLKAVQNISAPPPVQQQKSSDGVEEFCSSLVPRMRALTEYQKAMAQQKIISVLNEVQFNITSTTYPPPQHQPQQYQTTTPYNHTQLEYQQLP